jgi:AcrR family transcriptional regulator
MALADPDKTKGFFDVAFPLPERTEEAERGSQKQSTRDALLAAARDVFALSGYDGVSIRDVERRAGVNRGLVAHHFGSKEALWEAAIDSLMSDMSDELRRYWDFLGLVSEHERARILLRVYVHFVSRHPEFFRLFLIEGREPSPRSRHLLERYMRPLEEMFRAATGATEDAPAEERAIRHFTLMGAASTVFAAQAHCEYLFGVDPTDSDFVETFADAITDIWSALSEQRTTAAANDGRRAVA